jgi:hypothetical protein
VFRLPATRGPSVPRGRWGGVRFYALLVTVYAQGRKSEFCFVYVPSFICVLHFNGSQFRSHNLTAGAVRQGFSKFVSTRPPGTIHTFKLLPMMYGDSRNINSFTASLHLQ